MTGAAATGAVVNDVHSQLNETSVREVIRVDSLEALQAAVGRAREDGVPACVAGGRHAMGGQQFLSGGLLLDTRPLARTLSLDEERGVVELEAGVMWPALIAGLQPSRWAIAQKQTGADRLTLGGALAANAHGRALAMKPIAGDVESFTLVGPDGEVRTCNRAENAELFGLAIGGYGLFGAIYSVTLRLVPRRKLERVVEVRDIDGIADAFEQRIAAGFLYGDFQFSVDPGDERFLQRGVFSCYRPVADDTPVPAGQRALTTEDWKRLLYLAHVDKAQAFERYAAHYRATSGQIYVSDAHQLAEYLDEYHGWLDGVLASPEPATEMISELYVPRERLADFMAAAAEDFRAHGVDIVYGTIRLIERDDETFLAWARERFGCVIFNVHTVHTPDGIRHAAEAFRRLIDLAIERGGSYFLTYHRWARRDQVETCYPQLRDFLARKREHDPDEVFQSDWYRHHVELLAGA